MDDDIMLLLFTTFHT